MATIETLKKAAETNEFNFNSLIDCENNKPDSGRLYIHRLERIGNFKFGIYGNETENVNFLTIGDEETAKIFSLNTTDELSVSKVELLKQLLDYAAITDYQLDENLISGFNELGLMQREIASIPIIKQEDLPLLRGLAAIITKELLQLLKTEKVNCYKNLVRDVTDLLIDEGYIKIPVHRNFNFVIIP